MNSQALWWSTLSAIGTATSQSETSVSFWIASPRAGGSKAAGGAGDTGRSGDADLLNHRVFGNTLQVGERLLIITVAIITSVMYTLFKSVLRAIILQ